MDLGRSLLEAAREGSTERVYEFMSKGAPFTTDWLGTSPLHLAARNNHVDTCRVLLRGGLNKDSKTKVDRTPLHFAVFERHVEVVKLLLAHKCNPNAQDMLKMTPLHWAVEKNSLDIVLLLLQSGADPNIKSKFGKTPISLAAEKQNVAILKKLVDPIASTKTVKQIEAASSQQQVEEVGENTSKAEDEVLIEDIIESDADESLIEEDNGSTIGDAFMQLPDTETLHTSKAGMAILKEHGIQLMKVDDSGSVIQSALDSGRRLILSEAGKFILKNAINHSIFPKPGQSSVALARPKPNILQRRPLKKMVQLSSNEFKSVVVSPGTGGATGSPTRGQPKRGRSADRSPQPIKQPKLIHKFPDFGKLPQSTTITFQDRRHAQPNAEPEEVIDLDEVMPAINGPHESTVTLPQLEKQVHELKKETSDLRKQLEISQKQNQDLQRRLEKLEAVILSFHRTQVHNRSHSVT